MLARRSGIPLYPYRLSRNAMLPPAYDKLTSFCPPLREYKSDVAIYYWFSSFYLYLLDIFPVLISMRVFETNKPIKTNETIMPINSILRI